MQLLLSDYTIRLWIVYEMIVVFIYPSPLTGVNENRWNDWNYLGCSWCREDQNVSDTSISWCLKWNAAALLLFLFHSICYHLKRKNMVMYSAKIFWWMSKITNKIIKKIVEKDLGTYLKTGMCFNGCQTDTKNTGHFRRSHHWTLPTHIFQATGCTVQILFTQQPRPP